MENRQQISLQTNNSTNQSQTQASTISTPQQTAAGARLPPSGKPQDSPLKNNSPNKPRYKLALPHHPGVLAAKGANTNPATTGSNNFSLNIPNGANVNTANVSSGTSSLQFSGHHQMNQFNLMSGQANTISQNTNQNSLGSGGPLGNMLNPRLRSPNPVSSTAKSNLLTPNDYSANDASYNAIGLESSPSRVNKTAGQASSTNPNTGQVYHHTHRKTFHSSERTGSGAEAHVSSTSAGGTAPQTYMQPPQGQCNTPQAQPQKASHLTARDGLSPSRVLTSVHTLQQMQKDASMGSAQMQNDIDYFQRPGGLHAGAQNYHGEYAQPPHTGLVMAIRNEKVMKSRSPPQSESLLPNIRQATNQSILAPGSRQGAQATNQYRMNQHQSSNSMNRMQSGPNSQAQGGLALSGSHIVSSGFQRNGQNIINSTSGSVGGGSANLNNFNQNSRYSQHLPTSSSMRADSCDQVNNTTRSLQLMTQQQQYQSISQGNKESDQSMQRGRVLATNASRTGILTKTGMKAVYCPFQNESLAGTGITTNNFINTRGHNQINAQDLVGNPSRHGLDGSEAATTVETGGFESRAAVGHLNAQAGQVPNENTPTPGSIRSRSRKYSRGKSQGPNDAPPVNSTPTSISRLLGDEVYSGSGGSVDSDTDQQGIKGSYYVDNFLLANYQQDKQFMPKTQDEPIKVQDAADSDGEGEGLKGSTNQEAPQFIHSPSKTAQLPKIKEKGGKKTPAVLGQSKKDKNGQPFDFGFIKILIKKGNSDKDSKEVFIEREWVQKNNNIPHFSNVIQSVDRTEGVEITMNCNADAFKWIIDFVRIKTDGDDKIEEHALREGFISDSKKEDILDQTNCELYEKMDEIDNQNCLNIMVTAYFLQLTWVYDKVWDYYFSRNFSEVINQCKISLSNINQSIVRDIAYRISELQLERLEERKDKFISNVYKSRIDQRIINQKAGLTMERKDQESPESATKADESEFTHLYWCKVCQRLLTKEQALKISCLDLKKKANESKDQFRLVPSMSAGDINPLDVSELRSEDLSTEPTTTVEQDGIITHNGEMFVYHDIIFPEEMAYLAEDQMLENRETGRENLQEICSSEPIHIENFVKFFREKYRLCWKEIYLKFQALIMKAEKCKNCREWFQISEIAGCKAFIDESNFDEFTDQKTKLADLRFHALDFEEKELSSTNDLSSIVYDIYKSEVQVIDSITIDRENYQASQEGQDGKQDEKYFNHIGIILENYKQTVGFVEPQSMNFDVKINQVQIDFQQPKSAKEDKAGLKNGIKSAPNIKVTSSTDFYNKNGEILETLEQMIDDVLVRTPDAHIRIEKKLTSSKFMKKLQKECEQYVRENPQEFERMQAAKHRIDYGDNTIIEAAKKKDGDLDRNQMAAVQALVIKRFRRTRSMIMYEDDEASMKFLTNLLQNVKTDDEINGLSSRLNAQRLSHSQSKNQMSSRAGSPTKRQRMGQRPSADGRGKSPSDNKETHNNCDLSSQAGIKIYSNITQITVKKQPTKKAQVSQPAYSISSNSQQKKNVNFIQRNITRSQGPRSNSNQGVDGGPGIGNVAPQASVLAPVLLGGLLNQQLVVSGAGQGKTNSASRIRESPSGTPLGANNLPAYNATESINQNRTSQERTYISSGPNTTQDSFSQAVQEPRKHSGNRFMRSPAPMQGSTITSLNSSNFNVGNHAKGPQALANQQPKMGQGMIQLGIPNDAQYQNTSMIQNQNTNMINIQNVNGAQAKPIRGARSPIIRLNPQQMQQLQNARSNLQ